MSEWDRWKSANKDGMGKAGKADPNAGIITIAIIIIHNYLLQVYSLKHTQLGRQNSGRSTRN
jgi:hypothetical protein